MLYRLYVITCLILLPFSAAGETAPDFSGVDMVTGETINLTEYQGKVVFIDFWASWCPPCIQSLPAYEQMRRELGTEIVEIIAINVDENINDGLEFLQDHPVSYPMLADPEGEIGIQYGVRSLPESFLLDKMGNIVREYKGYQEGDETRIKQDIQTLSDQ